jgi:uncharacterized membrane protein
VPERERRFKRGGDAFERLAFFTDGVFAIAMTLIVVGIGVPALTDGSSVSDLWHGLGDHFSEFISFFIGVLVLGFYWIAHQESYDRLGAIDRRYLMGTVLYLGGIAFLPYPIRLVGAYSDNPLAWTLFAANLAVVSGLETILLIFAWPGRAAPGRDVPGRVPLATAHVVPTSAVVPRVDPRRLREHRRRARRLGLEPGGPDHRWPAAAGRRRRVR